MKGKEDGRGGDKRRESGRLREEGRSDGRERAGRDMERDRGTGRG